MPRCSSSERMQQMPQVRSLTRAVHLHMHAEDAADMRRMVPHFGRFIMSDW